MSGSAARRLVRTRGHPPSEDGRRRDHGLLPNRRLLWQPVLCSGRRVALTEGGRMAYWTDARTYDLVGLNSVYPATQGLDVMYLADRDPDLIFVHTADTLAAVETPSPDLLLMTTELLASTIREPRHWSEINDAVQRAPMVVYEYLSDRPDDYRVILARYGGELSHLYALKRGGNIGVERFEERLRSSFEPDARLSYLDKKATQP